MEVGCTVALHDFRVVSTVQVGPHLHKTGNLNLSDQLW